MSCSIKTEGLPRYTFDEWMERVCPDKKESEEPEPSSSIFRAMQEEMKAGSEVNNDDRIHLVCFLEADDPICQHMEKEVEKAAQELDGQVAVEIVREARFEIRSLIECSNRMPSLYISSFPATFCFYNNRALLFERPAFQSDYALFGQLCHESLVDLGRYAQQVVDDSEDPSTVLKLVYEI